MTNDHGHKPYPWRDPDPDPDPDRGTDDDRERATERNETRQESEGGKQTVETESQPQVINDHTELPPEFGKLDQADRLRTDRNKDSSGTGNTVDRNQEKRNKNGLFYTVYSTVVAVLSSPTEIGRNSTRGKDGLSGYFYPDGMLRSDEVVVFEAHPTWLLNPKNHLIGAVLMSAAIAITVVTLLGFGRELWNMPLPGSSRAVPSQWWILPTSLLFVGGLVYLYATIGRASTWYILTQDRLLKRKGVLRRQDKRISLSDINKTHTTRPPHMYPFGVGHIDIFTAATSGSEVRIEACQNISYRSELIDYQSKLAQMTPEERKKFAEQKT